MIHPKCLFSNLLNKMKKPSVKDLFAVWGVILFVSAGIWIVAQSNANDEAPIMIDTNKYTATQHIQEVHLNDTSSSKKIWLKNQDGLVLGVGSVGVDERVGKLKNDAGGASAVIAGSGNGNWWSESSLIVGGENNQLANGKIGSVVMGGKANQVDSSETVVLASKDSATHGTGAVVVAVDRGEVFGENSLSFAGDAIVRRNDSMVIGSAVMMNGEWSFVFNGREQQGIDVNTDNSFIVGANNGLIIGTNKNNGSGIGLTVNGAVKVGEARGNDNMQTGAIFRVACSSPAGASCLCANISGQVKSISSNPACNNVCAGKSKQCFLDAKCGTRAITYAAAETTRRANTDFCTVGSHVQGADPRFPNVGEVSWTCVSDFGGASANCSAKKNLLPKEDAKCGSYHGMNFMAASLTNWPAGWTFCEKGVPTPTVPAFPKTGKPVSWTCGGENLNTVPCSANGCNRCSKEGFPYCFPVDFGPSCGSTPTQPVNGQCGTSKDSCASGDFVDATDTATDYKWQCNGKNGGTSVACSLKKPTQSVNGKCGTTKNTCALWDFVDVADTLAEAKWQCNGKNGGSSVACSICNDGYVLKGSSCVKMELPVNKKSCKFKESLFQIKDCEATEKETFKKVVYKKVPSYHTRGYTVRLKKRWGESWNENLPEYLRRGIPIRPSASYTPSQESFFSVLSQWDSGWYRRRFLEYQNGSMPIINDSNQIDPTDELYVKIDPQYFSTLFAHNGDSRLINIWNTMWSINSGPYPEFEPGLAIYQKVERNAQDLNLDDFCYYDNGCHSKAYAVACENTKTIRSVKCKEYSDQNTCNKNTKCEWSTD